MIIDVHCHVWEEKPMSPELKQILIEVSKRFGLNPKIMMEETSKRLIREMDEAGIDRAVIVAVGYKFAYKGDVSFKDYNNYVAEIEKYPDSFISLCGIDPQRRKAAIKRSAGWASSGSCSENHC